jgi:hypothetical protein
VKSSLRSPKRKLRENAFLITEPYSLGSRLGLQSMYFLTDFFADRRERATSKLATGGFTVLHYLKNDRESVPNTTAREGC